MEMGFRGDCDGRMYNSVVNIDCSRVDGQVNKLIIDRGVMLAGFVVFVVFCFFVFGFVC